jgi:hypothetical protein
MKKLLLFLLIGISNSAFAQHPCVAPAININGASWKCKGERDTLTVNGPNGTTYVWDNGKTTISILTGDIDGDSTFYVVATNGGCSDTGYFTVVLRLPPIVRINPASLFCAGEPITLSASATGTNPPFTYIWSTGQTGTSITINPGPDTTTTYEVYASNGCSSVTAITITPGVPILSACCGNNISPGDSVLLVTTGNSVVYQWSPSVHCLNPPLCDSVEVAPAVTTSYTVTGLDSSGCQAEETLLIIVSPAGVSSISGNNFINIYPNPSSTEFAVNLQIKALLNVCDITGRILFSEMENPGNVTFGKELNPGIYFLFIDGEPAGKIVKI